MKKKFSVLAGLCMLVAFVSPAKDNNENREVPLFKENKGQLVDQHSQSRQDIQYYGSSDGLSYFFKNTGISYQLYKNEADDKVMISRIDMTWEGANTNAKIISTNKAITTDNFYNSPQPDGITGVRNYGDLQYKDIYAGIDLHYYYKNGSLKYDFIVAPGADYKNIQIKVAGASSLLENNDGTISIKTPSGVLTEGMPVAYQNGKEIKTSWILEKDMLSFQLSEYNAALPVVIDPLVYQWTVNEGSPSGLQVATTSFYRNTFDAAGNLYIARNASGVSPYPSSNTLYKYNTSGVSIWSKSFFTPDAQFFVYINSLSVNGSSVYMAGQVKNCTNLATTGAYQTTINAQYDGFLIKYDTAGTKLWATYYGGTGNDFIKGCKADSAGNVFVCGITDATSNLSSTGAYQTSMAGIADAFIAKFSSGGTRVWGTYFGGAGADSAKSIDVRANRIYISGSTQSTSGIAMTGAQQATFSGTGVNGFLLCMDTAGVPQWSTYYGDGTTYGENCFVAGSAVYLSGSTNATTNIATAGIFQPANGGGFDGFVAKFNLSGVRQWGTYYGGANYDIAKGSTIGKDGRIYLCGNTYSTTGIATANTYNPTYVASVYQYYNSPQGSAYLAELDTNGQRVSGSYINAGTFAECCSANNNGDVLVSGSAIMDLNDFKAFITKFNYCNSPTPVVTASVNNICTNASSQLSTTAVPGSAYQWYQNNILVPGATSNNYMASAAGTYKLILDQCPSGVSNEVVITSVPIPVTQITKTDAPCSNAILGSIALTTSSGTPPYTYIWDNSTNTTSTLTGLTPGSYIVHTSDVNNCSKTDTVTILNTHNEPVTVMSHTNVPCYGAPIGSATVATSGGTTPYSYAWDGQTATTATITGLATGTYKVLVTDANNCMAADSTIVTQDTSIAPSDPLVSLCAVTVDSATGKNIIFWNKTGDVRATSYNIYREGTASGNYELVGSKSVTDMASIIDTASIPLQQSYSYKVSEVDSCGHEWPLSDLHKTIHLSANVGVNGENNLIWNIYEGRPYTTHNIWRSFNGAPFTLLNQVSSTITSYSDLTPPTGNNVYRIEIDLGVSCDSLDPGSQHITSNKVSLGTNTTGINGVNGLGSVQIVPNPTKGILNILGEMPAHIKLYDALGRLVTEERNVNKMDIGKFSKGMYMIQLFDKNGAVYHSQKVLLN